MVALNRQSGMVWGIGNPAEKGYTMKFGMKDKLVGVVSTCNAEINNPKLKTSWEGEIKFKWDEVTLEDVINEFGTDNRKIAYASTARKDLGTLRGVKSVTVTVKKPGTRTGVSTPMTPEAVETYLASLPADERKAIVDKVRKQA